MMLYKFNGLPSPNKISSEENLKKKKKCLTPNSSIKMKLEGTKDRSKATRPTKFY